MTAPRSKVARRVPAFLRRALAPLGLALLMLLKRPRGWWDYVLDMISERRRAPRAYGRPVSITIEPANVCNLRCPVCETGAGHLGRTPRFMSYDEFLTIMAKVAPGANQLLFYFMGEPFLNKEAYRMIRYARDMGLYVTTCTNGELVDPEALYESGINHVSFQIGGTTQETHAAYRQGADLAGELDVLRRYLEIIRVRGRKAGEHRVELGFIVMKHNEHEVNRFLAMARDWGVEGVVISPCVRTPEQGDQFLPRSDAYWLFDREVFEKERRLVPQRVRPPNTCPWVYYGITIQVDGAVVACCRDTRGDCRMGNLLHQSLDEVWNGPKFQALRRAVHVDQSKVALCGLCGGYGPPTMY